MRALARLSKLKRIMDSRAQWFGGFVESVWNNSWYGLNPIISIGELLW